MFRRKFKKDIRNNVGQDKLAMPRLLWSNHNKYGTKVGIYNSTVQNILTYASETWKISKHDRQRINAV